MLKLATTLLGLTLTLGSAQAQSAETLYLPIAAVCIPTKNVDKELKSQYNEIPLAEGVGTVYNSVLQDYIVTRTRIFLDPNSFSFSIVVDVPKDGMSCVVITGEEFQPSRK
jgi:hypothetical protein